jgi:uncharacterized protein YdeI (BOF family)
VAILNSKTVVIPIIVLSFAAGAGAMAVINHPKKDNKNSSNTVSKATSTSSPAAVIKDVSSYSGKQVTLQGILISVTDTKTYLLADNNTKSPGAIKLDFSKSGIDPAKLVTNTATTSAPTAPPASAGSSAQPVSSPGGTANGNKSSAKSVTVTGTVTTEASGQPVLIVKSAE